MALRGRGAPHSVIIPLDGFRITGSAGAVGGAPGTDAARFYVPSLPDSNGIVIRSARVFKQRVLGVATTPGVFTVLNQTTTMLSAALTTTGAGTAACTLANNGQEIVAAGRYVRIDATGATWTSTNGFSGVSVQVDYDRL